MKLVGDRVGALVALEEVDPLKYFKIVCIRVYSRIHRRRYDVLKSFFTFIFFNLLLALPWETSPTFHSTSRQRCSCHCLFYGWTEQICHYNSLEKFFQPQIFRTNQIFHRYPPFLQHFEREAGAFHLSFRVATTAEV